jgi:serine/threonine protein kinase
MGGQTAEQIIAGVVLSERLAVTMYGAIHRAQWGGQRNNRGLVVDPRMLDEAAFRVALTDPERITTAITLMHPMIVPTVAVESNGPDVVVVTRGVGRYVTVQDLISSAHANRTQGGKLPLPVAAAIVKSVVEALAAAHRANVIHGAVHPRSVLVDEDGAVRLTDFVVGRALTSAVAQGADSVLWKGLSGYLAPELAVGEDPSPACDVFAAGALLFTMLSGEVPPGTLHVTPAVERLVQRALDTDLARRYRTAGDLLENMLEAFEDDRWQVADRGDVIKAAGLTQSDANIDDATEDLLASLGSAPGAIQVTPIRPSMDLRAESVAARHQKTPTAQNRLDALLADLDDSREHTVVDDHDNFRRDPISEVIQRDPRRREAIVQARPRVPSLDDPDDDEPEHTPLPPPARDSDADLVARPNVRDELAAMDALSGLDEPARRVSSAAEQAALAAEKLEQAAIRVEAAASRVDVTGDAPPARVRQAPPVILEPAPDFDLPPPRLKSRAVGVVMMLIVIGGGIGFYFIYKQQQEDREQSQRDQDEAKRRAEEQTRAARESLADAGSLRVTSSPSQAGVWLRIGRTPVDTLRLQAGSTHELALVLDGHQLGEVQVVAGNWSGDKDRQRAVVNVTLPKLEPDKKTGKVKSAELPLQPTAVHAATAAKGQGPIHVESSPIDAEVFLYVGLTGTMQFDQLTAGRDYEVVVVKDGYKARHLTIKADDWRDGGDPSAPIDLAKKKRLLERSVELEPAPVDSKKGK